MVENCNIEEIFNLASHLDDKDRKLITKAYDLAEKAHGGQMRGSGEPYFTHVFAVAKNLAEFNMDARTIAAGLMHDVLEDTDISEDEMQAIFGEEIVFLVNGVTKLGKLKYQGRERHVESLRKFFIAMAEDIRVLMIKLADRLHNVSTLEGVRPEKRERIAKETLEVHAALAGRLGMGKLKGLLEDYSFKYAFPKEWSETDILIKENVGDAQKSLESVRKDLDEALKTFGIKEYKLDQRVKHHYSLYQKLKKYKGEKEKIYDIVALRVQVSNIADCYQVFGIVHGLWKPMPGRIKDYIALPKTNGYQSLHTTVATEYGVAEIQIRTFGMHQEADFGIASHLMYKETGGSGQQLRTPKKLEWINDLKELQKIVSEPGSFLEELRMDFFKNRIFIFTPKGDVIDLPEDSCPIDVAYTIHSGLGNMITGAKVNGKLSSLDIKLKNGDLVEIMTGKNGKPASKWLDYVKTTMAKKHIKSYLAEHGGFIDRFKYKNH